MPTLMQDLESICFDIFSRWDADQRSGKLLQALQGALSSYDPRVTRIRAALRTADIQAEARATAESDEEECR